MLACETSDLLGTSGALSAFLTTDVGMNLGKLCFVSICNTPSEGYEDQNRIGRLVWQEWARIQQSSVHHLKKFVSSGIPVCDAQWIRQGIETLLKFVSVHQLFPPLLHKYFRECRDHIEETMQLWVQSNLPQTVVHGDLHEGNVANPGGPESGFIFFDWESVFVGYPFLELMDSKFNPLFRHDQFYIQSWIKYCDIRSLKDVAERTRPLSYLIRAIRDAQTTFFPIKIRKYLILENVERFCEGVQEFRCEQLARLT